jgi:hypothetical protein
MVEFEGQAGDSGARVDRAPLGIEIDRTIKYIADRFRCMSNDVGNITAVFSAEETMADVSRLYFQTPAPQREELMESLLSLSIQ